jgi:prenyltransferase beta subunit
VTWLKSCQNEDGGFGGNVKHDSHITSTHYAILVLLVFQQIEYPFSHLAKSTSKR